MILGGMDGTLTAEISAGAIRENLALLRGRLARGVKLCAVVKCDAYGLGIQHALPALIGGADWLAVATPAEAMELRDLGWDGPVLLFFGPEIYASAVLAELLRRDVTLTVADAADLAPLAEAAAEAGTPAEVHVLIDTGMTRSGIHPDDAPSLLAAIADHAHLRLTGVYTHLACAEDADKTDARGQLERFERALREYPVPAGVLRHAANTAGLLDLPESHFDLVRPGLGVWGYLPSSELQAPLPLRPALRLTAPLMDIKPVAAGTRAGYGGTFTFTRDCRVGLVPVGYGDGHVEERRASAG